MHRMVDIYFQIHDNNKSLIIASNIIDINSYHNYYDVEDLCIIIILMLLLLPHCMCNALVFME